MMFKAGVLVLTLLIGSNAFPAQEEDYSVFFDHTDASSRIVGGSTAGVTPHMVALTTGVFSRSLLCGASIVNNRFVLTAAHCIIPVRIGNNLSSSLRGIVGSQRFASGGREIVFNRAIVHENYLPSPLIKNDIGLLVASSNIAFTNAIGPVRLSYNWAGAGVPTIATGWGRTRAGGAISQVLLQLHANVIDGEVCRTEVPRIAAQVNLRNVPPVDPNIEICTFIANGQGMCNGDSGSALLRRDTNEQIGIVSWGIPCARGAPDMFARVSAYADWLRRNIN